MSKTKWRSAKANMPSVREHWFVDLCVHRMTHSFYRLTDGDIKFQLFLNDSSHLHNQNKRKQTNLSFKF